MKAHVTIPQLGGMYEGDRARKEMLVAHGFRLPSCLDNRPLKFHEVEKILKQRIYVSATPGPMNVKMPAGMWLSRSSVRRGSLILLFL